MSFITDCYVHFFKCTVMHEVHLYTEAHNIAHAESTVYSIMMYVCLVLLCTILYIIDFVLYFVL